jgi:ABC-2 type transport system permease protein
MMTGWTMLFYKEVLRFWKVSFQTVAAPVLTAVMYLMIFGHVLEAHVQVYDGVSYTAFLIPGLVMMSVLQNAFANSSSSMVQSKIMGNLVFLLLTPLSHWSWFFAYALSAMVRGLLVGAGVLLAGVLFVWQSSVLNFSLMPTQPLWVLTFAVLGALMLGTLGLIAGLWADKFDQMAAFQNFIIMPMTFLSGVFYSIHSLPNFWQSYMIDGFRFGFFGQSDVSPWLSLGVVGVCLTAVSAIALHLLRTGYKIRG